MQHLALLSITQGIEMKVFAPSGVLDTRIACTSIMVVCAGS